MNKISFCTISKNRLFHIQETLPVNIQENIGFPNIEFILLDYNSTDGLEDWIKSNMMPYLETGILKYYRTTEPAYFNMAHSKNMSINLASGDILCMIDADNYAGAEYSIWINNMFNQKGKNTLVMPSKSTALIHGDLGGKISFHRDFYSTTGGFDESMTGYGMDDVDLINRIVKAGGIEVYIEDIRHMKFIRHSHDDRLKNYRLLNELKSIHVNVISFDETSKEVLYLMKDGSYCKMVFKFNKEYLNDKTLSFGGWYLEKERYKKGKTKRIPKGFLLIDEQLRFYKDKPGQLFSYSQDKQFIWEEVCRDSAVYMKLLIAYSDCLNRIKYHDNDKLGDPVNPTGPGKGTAYLNFDYSNPIYT